MIMLIPFGFCQGTHCFCQIMYPSGLHERVSISPPGPNGTLHKFLMDMITYSFRYSFYFIVESEICLAIFSLLILPSCFSALVHLVMQDGVGAVLVALQTES